MCIRQEQKLNQKSPLQEIAAARRLHRDVVKPEEQRGQSEALEFAETWKN